MYKFLSIILCIASFGIFHQSSQAQDSTSSNTQDSTKTTKSITHPNLVRNPGFEEKKKVISGLGQIKLATGWRSVSDANGDLFSSGAQPGEFSAFGNKYGKETPKEGNTYAGFLAYSLQNQESRSYIYGKLDKSLKKGKMYCATISVSLADKSKFTLQDLGIYFSDKKAKTKKNEHLLVRPQVLPSIPKWRDKSDGWQYICNSFRAKGGEEYIVLGNFFSNHETIVKKINLPEDSVEKLMPVAYYYVDEIKVQLIDSSAACNCEVKEEEKYVAKVVYYSKSSVSEEELTDEQKVFSSAVHFMPFQKKISHLELEHDSIFNDIDRLTKLAKLLKEKPEISINVLGHSDKDEYFWPDSLLTEMASLNPEFVNNTDSVPTNIAKKRVDIVIDFLCSEGISEHRLVPVIKNHESPIDTANNLIAKAKNRRVEFSIIGLEEKKKLQKLQKNKKLMVKDTVPATFKYIDVDTIIDPKDQD